MPATMALRSPTPVSSDTTVVSDSFNRTSERGWASADQGGAYSVSNPTQSTVAPGGGQLSLPTPGRSATALLLDTKGLNTRINASFALTSLPTSGSGVYAAVILRRQSNKDSYRARARVMPGGVVRLSFSKVLDGKETLIGGEAELSQRLKQGDALDLTATIKGTDSVSLTSEVSIEGASVSATHHVTDTSATRITDEGSLGLSGFLSSTGTATALRFRSLTGVTLGGNTKPPVTTAPTTPAATPSQTPTPTPTLTTPVHTTVPTPPSTGPGGSAAVGSTSYAVPANAVFASPNGSDSGSGGSGSPFRTLAKAIAAAPSGSTIVLRAGSYHESVKIPANKTLTIQSYPKEAVWLDGSSEVTGWQSSGRAWVKSNWTASFNSVPSFSGTVSAASGFQFISAAYPMAAHPDQVWIGSTALQQVGSTADLKAGTFYLNDAADKLYVGSNPAGETVRASDLVDAMTINSPGSVVRGIGVHRYATSLSKYATVKAVGKGDILENLVVSDNATSAVSATVGNITLRKITTERNGMLGLIANQADGLVIDSVRSANNNVQHFNMAPVSGGVKVTRTRGVTIRDSVFENNLGVGIWMDESVYDITLTGNDISGSGSHGISLELSAKAVVADNIITGSARDGIKINDTDGVQLWNNTFRGNGRSVEIVQDARDASNPSTPGHDPRRPIPDPTMTWKVGRVTMSNNILSHPTTVANCLLCVEDFTHKRSAEQMKVAANGNVYNRASAGSPSWEVIWSSGAGNPKTFTTLSAFTASTGQEKDSMAKDGSVFAPQATAESPDVAQPLPASVATEVGQPAGTKHLGAWR